MVQSQLHHRDIRDPYVLESFGRVPRHRFVSAGLQSQACNDQPLPIGSEADDLPAARGRLHAAGLATTVGGPGAGAGCCMRLSDRPSGTAVAEVHAIELVPELAAQADATLRELKCKGVRGVAGNGLSGAPERAPFDAIIGSAAAPPRTGRPAAAAGARRADDPAGGRFAAVFDYSDEIAVGLPSGTPPASAFRADAFPLRCRDH